MATKFTKGGIACSVHDIRESLPQGFIAPGWTDLRVGFLASVTSATDVDDCTDGTIEESVGVGPTPVLGSFDRYFIGVLDVLGHCFMGFSNRGVGTTVEGTTGSSILTTSDGGLGTTNANFWRPANGANTNYAFQIIDIFNTRAMSLDGSQIHFAQDPVGSGGYATLLTMRLQRDNATSHAKVISVSTKRDAVNHSADVLYTDTPTADLLETHLQAFPTTVQQLGPIELSQEPTRIYIYWPFRNSRIRIHKHGILKAG